MKIRFEPAGVTVHVEDGTRVLDAAKSANIVVAATCGGRGICGACGVRVTAGALCAPDEAELAGLKRAPNGVRLACRARVCGPVTIRPLVAVDGVALGGLEEADELLAPLRALADPIMDTWAMMPASAMATIHMDPPEPVPCLLYTSPSPRDS